MSNASSGRDLFIVDNSVSGWTGLRYLDEWSGIARAFDIATGYFEIGALLALDGKWQSLEKIRMNTSCGWSRSIAVKALDEDDVRKERESFTREEEQMVERACEDVSKNASAE